MENFSLHPDESVLYKGEGRLLNKNEKSLASLSATTNTEVLLTNQNLVFIRKTKKLFAKEQAEVETYPISDIKIYNETPQLKQNGSCVEIYFICGEKVFDFFSKHEAHTFIKKAYELLTGKSMAVRGAEKVKSALNLVDNTLGIDTVTTVKNVIENGMTKSVVGGLGKGVSHTADGIRMAREAKNIASDLFGKIKPALPAEQSPETNPSASYEEQIAAIKQMKELLDAGILTQEEFDAKKKEILGL